MKPIWTAILIFCLCLIAYLVYTLDNNVVEVEPEYDYSPNIRVQIQRETGEITMTSDGQGFDIWFASADKPISKKGLSITITRSENTFSFLDIKQDTEWIEIVPKSELFKLEYNGKSGHYPGRIRLYPVDKKSDMMSIINILPLEPYVSRVIDGEMNQKWPMETLKSQAIIARTYALYHIKRPLSPKRFDIYGYSLSQAYSSEPPSNRAIRAVRETANTILEYDNKIMVTYYVNTCGGKTVSAIHASRHSKVIPPLSGVTCPYCTESPYFNWTVELSKLNFSRIILGPKARSDSIRRISIEYHKEHRASNLLLTLRNSDKKSVKATTFRKRVNQFFGKERMKSLNFSIRTEGSKTFISGKGWGHHGVGLCQYGAKQMGTNGNTCAEILSFYYPKSSLVAYNWQK